MTRSVIQTDEAPAAIGPYSQAILSGSYVFLSGQIPLDPVTGELLSSTVEEETHRVMKNLAGVLRAAGSSFECIVKTTIYLTDMNDFAKVNGVYATYFESQPPARATVQAAALPKGARVEIDAIAEVAD